MTSRDNKRESVNLTFPEKNYFVAEDSTAAYARAAPRLVLTVDQSLSLEPGTQFHINAGGLENS